MKQRYIQPRYPENVSSLMAVLLTVFCLAGPLSATAGYKYDTHFTRLQDKLGAAMPTGDGIPVTQVEATSGSEYLPDSSDAQFVGVTITDVTGVSAGTSSHATQVGRYFYGDLTAMATNITIVDCYSASNSLQSGFLNSANPALEPLVEPNEVQNYSWVGSWSQSTNAIRRFDHAIVRDGFTAVVGLNNTTSSVIPDLMAHSYNAISVGKSSGVHSRGRTLFDDAGRVKPEIVAPLWLVSYNCPLVAGAAAMLREEAAGTSALTNALKPECIKALIMGGATRRKFPDWDRTHARPIDDIYGAGELNIFNSYFILTAGQQESSTTSSVSSIGWDTATVDGVSTSLYFFTVSPSNVLAHLSTMLCWNRIITDANPSPSVYDPVPTLPNLELSLYSASGLTLGSLLDWSTSTVDNVEHIYQPSLTAGDYAIAVSGDSTSDYALAWLGKEMAKPEITQSSVTNGYFEAGFNATTGFWYAVEVSTNLINTNGWTVLSTNNADQVPLVIGDPDSTNWVERYYRLIPID